jgi:hypothetical protein
VSLRVRLILHACNGVFFTRKEESHESENHCSARNLAVFPVRPGADRRLVLQAWRKLLPGQLLWCELLPGSVVVLPRRLLPVTGSL